MSDALRDVFENEVIRASAGTGKTFELSNRFIQLLASGADCETILATTFTRKGAGEILDRIVQRLSRAALSADETTVLASQLGWKLDQARVQDLLRELIDNLHRLQIGTLDAFFYRIAQSFRLEMGLPTQWQIVNERQIAALHDQVVNEILNDQSVISILHMLTKGDAQRRVAQLIRSTVDQLYDIRRQSTEAAWNRLELPAGFTFERNFDEQIDQLLSLDYPHGSQRNKVESDIELVKNRDWTQLAKSRIVENISGGNCSYYRKPLPDECVRIYRQFIEHCRGVIIDMLIRKNSSTFKLLDKFGRKLESEKTETGQLRFDDINVRLEDFIKGKQTEDFAFRLDHNIDHLLLDEFQDTSISQWNVIEPFAERTTENDARKSFFCVGDLKQAIFGWRGGVAEIFDTVEAKLSNMTEGRRLIKSYRSSSVIIDSVNQVFGNLDRFESDRESVTRAIEQWSKRFEIHETALADLPGYFSLEFAGDSDQKGRAKHPDRNANTLAKTVDRVRQIQQQTPANSIGVLVRKNETVGELIYLLREAGIAASEEGGNPLTDSAAVELMLSLVTLADHPGDSIARFHLSHSPLRDDLGLQPENISNQKQNITSANVAAERIRGEMLRDGLGATMERFARILSAECTERELLRLQQLVEEAFNFEKSNDQARTRLRPVRFVDHIRHEFKASDESSAQVRVMTIHQCKGLEFDVVVLPMLFEQNGWFSHQATVVVGREHPTSDIDLVCRLANQSHRNLLPREFQEAFDESKCREVMDSLCVLYVAMTRAVHSTYVVMSHSCKPDQDSSAAILLATLYPDERKEGVVFSLGDREWYQKLTIEENLSENRDSQDYYLPENAMVGDVQLSSDIRSGRGIQKVAPSGFEGGNKIQMSAIFDTISNQRQLNRGTYIHACFELIEWLDEEIPAQDVFDRRLKQLGPIENDTDEQLPAFLKMLEQPRIAKLLRRQYYRDHDRIAVLDQKDVRIKVRNERAFATVIDQRLMHGSIDRLVLMYHKDQIVAADVIDFKTDDVSGAKLDRKVKHYRPQMDAYRRAVSKFCGIPAESVSAKLVFVNQDLIVDLDGDSQNEIETSTPRQEPSADAEAKSDSVDDVSRPNFMRNQQLRLWSEE